MPYQSLKQERWAHTPQGEMALGGPMKVAEWDKASEGMSLPVYAKKPKKMMSPEQHRRQMIAVILSKR